jgi:hypothetical protein
MDRAALRCLLILLPKQQVQITKKPIEAELDRFSDYLLNICGISPQTCVNRRQHICAFLKHRFDTAPPDISQISGDDIDAFFQHLALKWQPASLREVILTRALIFWATHLEPGDQRTVGESTLSTLVRRSVTKRRKRYGRKLEAGSYRCVATKA